MTERLLFIKMAEQALENNMFVSFVSNKPLQAFLNTPKFYSCFAHVIPKKGHTRLNFENTGQRTRLLKLNSDNIVLLTPYEHFLYDHGNSDLIAKYEKENNVSFNKLYKLKEALIEQIKELIMYE